MGSNRRYGPTIVAAMGLGVIGGLSSLSGCSRDVHLAGRKIPHVTVKPVKHYGIALDTEATPQQVAFAALQAIRDDFLAKSDAEREAALAKQFDLCAANIIAQTNLSSLTRDEYVYNVVYHWTPTVSHYIGDFPTTWEQAEERLVRRPVVDESGKGVGAEECEVVMEVGAVGDDASARVVLIVWLAKDHDLWRVVHLGFDNRQRSIAREEDQRASATSRGS